MLEQEKLYQLIFKQQWSAILDLLYKNKSDITNDPLLQHAALTFENEFFKKLPSCAINDNETNAILDKLYVLHFGKFYLLKADNLKILIVELVKRKPLKEAYNYAKEFPEEEVCLKAIKEYEVAFGKPENLALKANTPITMNWIEIYNRLFELINQPNEVATYLSGPRFIQVVKNARPYFPDYNQYIALRNQVGKSTSRKIFYYDILWDLDILERTKVTEEILALVKPFQPQKVMAIEMLLGKKALDQTVVEATDIKTASTESPIVFISYSWDNESQKEWVLKLADRLILNGVNVILDRYEARAGRSLPQLIEQAISRAGKIIIVFTPNYKLRADNRSGGVGYEYSIMNAALYKNQKNEKIIPVLRSGTMEDSIPEFMQQYIHLDLRNDENFENSFTDLLREIFNEPAINKPPVGTKPDFNQV